MISPQRAYDEVVDSGEGLVPGVMESIILCLEVNQPCWLDAYPLKKEGGR